MSDFGLMILCNRDLYLVFYDLNYKISISCLLSLLFLLLESILFEEIGLWFGYGVIGKYDNNLICNFM